MKYVLPAALGACILFAAVFCLNALRIALRALRRAPLDETVGRLKAEKGHVPLDRISDVFLRVLVCAEDHRFAEHRGFDIAGIRHAAAVNIREHRPKARMLGGSTITQQLVKNIWLGPEKTFTRKLAELFLSLRAEKELTKPEILELYCNVIYYGRGCRGVSAAAETFFGCLPAQLSLNRSLTLACRLPNPDLYDPDSSPELFAKARETALRHLAEHSVGSPRTVEELRLTGWKDEAPALAAEKGTWN